MRPPLRGNSIEAWRARMALYEMRKQAVLSVWLQYQWVILPVLIIPLAILLGMRRTNGAILVSNIGALLATAFIWYREATSPIAFGAGGTTTLDSAIFQTLWVLLLASWTLTLAHIVRARRWGWLALIVVGGYLSYAAILLSEILPAIACVPSSLDDGGFSGCTQPNQAVVLLIAAGRAIGPAVALLYISVAADRRQRQLPEGLVVTSLREKTQLGEQAD